MKKQYDKEKLLINFQDKEDPVISALKRIADKFGLDFIHYLDPHGWMVYVHMSIRNTCEKPDLKLVELGFDNHSINSTTKKMKNLYNVLDEFYSLAGKIKEKDKMIRDKIDKGESWREYYGKIHSENKIPLEKIAYELARLNSNLDANQYLSDKEASEYLSSYINKRMSDWISSSFKENLRKIEEKYAPEKERISEREKRAKMLWKEYQRKKFNNFVNKIETKNEK